MRGVETSLIVKVYQVVKFISIITTELNGMTVILF